MKISEVYGTSYGTNEYFAQQLDNKLLKSISTSGKSMFIDFKKQLKYGSIYGSEFMALIKYKKIDFDCQTWLDVQKNILMSPDHHNSMNCSWLITFNFGSYIILNFKFIDVISYS